MERPEGNEENSEETASEWRKKHKHLGKKSWKVRNGGGEKKDWENQRHKRHQKKTPKESTPEKLTKPTYQKIEEKRGRGGEGGDHGVLKDHTFVEETDIKGEDETYIWELKPKNHQKKRPEEDSEGLRTKIFWMKRGEVVTDSDIEREPIKILGGTADFREKNSQKKRN